MKAFVTSLNVSLGILLICAGGPRLSAQVGGYFAGGALGGTFFRTMVAGDSLPPLQTRHFYCSPQVGYWMTAHIQVGLGLSVSTSSAMTRIYDPAPGGVYSGRERELDLGAQAWLRYCFGRGNFRPFTGINALYTRSRLESSWSDPLYPDTKNQSTTWNASLQLGFIYSLARRVQVYGSLGGLTYEQSRVRAQGTDLTRSQRLGFELGRQGDPFLLGLYFDL